MPKVFRTFTKRFFIIANLVVAGVFLLACLASYLNPVKWWFIAFLGLAFPYILLFVFLFIVLWAVFKSRWVFLNLALILIGWTNINAVFAFHLFPKKFVMDKTAGRLRVLQWNCMSFGGYERNAGKSATLRDGMLNYIKEQDADVLCLQEFFDSYDPAYHQNLKEVSERLGYPNYYFSRDYPRVKWSKEKGDEPIGHWGTIIFSRLPVVDSGKAVYPPDGENHESLRFLDVLHGGDTLRIMSTHLQSVKFGRKEYDEMEKISGPNQTAIKASKGVFAKIRRAYTNRSQQAQIVRNQVRASPYPVILTGDFNDVPNSYTYFTIKGNLQDAFLKKGFGIGRTYSALSPTLRIDYILASKKLRVCQFKKENKKLSDHYPLVADFEVKR
jgi:endonuclease/exonuclease/phosphatase family metal-dependent hydrolase